MVFKKLKKMKKEYASFRQGRRTFLIDTSLFDFLNEQQDGAFAKILDEGYGLAGTKARIKVEFQREAEEHAPECGTISIAFPEHEYRFYVDVESEKTYVYDRATGRQEYVLVRPYAYRLAVYYGDCHDAMPVYTELCGNWSTEVLRDIKEGYIETEKKEVPA